MSRRRLRVTTTIVAIAGLVLGAAVNEAIAGPPGGDAPSLGATVAASGWWAVANGWAGLAVMVALYLGGRSALLRRGWIVRRWPWLDRGIAWAGLSSLLGVLTTAIPLAITGELTADALAVQSALAVGLLVRGDLGDVKRAAEAKDGAS